MKMRRNANATVAITMATGCVMLVWHQCASAPRDNAHADAADIATDLRQAPAAFAREAPSSAAEKLERAASPGMKAAATDEEAVAADAEREFDRSASRDSASTFLAPRVLNRALPAEIVERDSPVSQRGKAPPIDGCSYDKLDTSRLTHSFSQADFVGLVSIDYDYEQTTRFLASDGSVETPELTRLITADVHDVLLDRVGQPFDELYLVGSCGETGLCRVHDCEQHISSGLNLVFASRYCGHSTRDRVVMLVLASYPLQEGQLYDFDGSHQSLSQLLEAVTIDRDAMSPTAHCGDR